MHPTPSLPWTEDPGVPRLPPQAPPTCLEPAILGEGASRFFWSVPVFSEHRRPSDQQLPFLLLEPRGHLQHGRQWTPLRREAPPAFLVTPSPHPLLKLDTSLEMTENVSFNTRPQVDIMAVSVSVFTL